MGRAQLAALFRYLAGTLLNAHFHLIARAPQLLFRLDLATEDRQHAAEKANQYQDE
jgi:hypothetical protein